MLTCLLVKKILFQNYYLKNIEFTLGSREAKVLPYL